MVHTDQGPKWMRDVQVGDRVTVFSTVHVQELRASNQPAQLLTTVQVTHATETVGD